MVEANEEIKQEVTVAAATTATTAAVVETDELDSAQSSKKIELYSEAKNRWASYLNVNVEATEQEKQLKLSEILSEIFGDEFSFVGFYDKRENNDAKIFIGEYVSNAEIFPCGEIKMGDG